MSEAMEVVQVDVIDAMINGHSTREYEPLSRVSEELTQYLTALCSETTTGPFGKQVRFIMTTEPIGVHGLCHHPPAAIIGCAKIDGTPNDPYEDWKAAVDFAYCLEKISIEARARGLGTLWLAKTFDIAKAESLIQSNEDEFIFGVITVGNPGTPGMMEKIANFAMRLKSRYPMRKVFYGNASFKDPIKEEEWKDTKFFIPLECVRTANSAINKQPWRIVVDYNNDMCHLFVKPAAKWTFLDAGIAMFHFERAVQEGGLSGKWERYYDTEETIPVNDIPRKTTYISTFQFS